MLTVDCFNFIYVRIMVFSCLRFSLGFVPLRSRCAAMFSVVLSLPDRFEHRCVAWRYLVLHRVSFRCVCFFFFNMHIVTLQHLVFCGVALLSDTLRCFLLTCVGLLSTALRYSTSSYCYVFVWL